MRKSLFVALAVLASVGCVESSLAQSVTQMRLLGLPNPSPAGAPVTLRAEVDSLDADAATGWTRFFDGATRLGYGKLSAIGAGQATFAGGGAHSCALTRAGGVQCWGANDSGQLGDGGTTRQTAPVDVVGLTSGVVALAAGSAHSCALTTAGAVKCWGRNNYGQLGDRTTTTRLTPVDVFGLSSGVIAIGAGGFHSCALTAVGGVKCWGRGVDGEIGDGDNGNRARPTDAAGLTRGVTAIGVGGYHNCAITGAGGVKCWGFNQWGQVGNGTSGWGMSILRPADVVGMTSGVVAVTAGIIHSCALTGAGGAKCWGRNYHGQLGDGGPSYQSDVPLDVFGLQSGVAAIAAGGSHTCALRLTGGMKCWGANDNGNVGDGTQIHRRVPVDVVGLSSGAVAITLGDGHSCAATGGVLKCWGLNSSGQIGDGSRLMRVTPVSTKNFTGLVRSRASLVTPPLIAGAHYMKAYYRGDATHAASSARMLQRVQ